MARVIYHCPRCKRLVKIEEQSFCTYCGKFFPVKEFWTNMEVMG